MRKGEALCQAFQYSSAQQHLDLNLFFLFFNVLFPVRSPIWPQDLNVRRAQFCSALLCQNVMIWLYYRYLFFFLFLKNGSGQPGGRGIQTIIPKFNAWEPPWVTDTPLGGMEKVMIGGREGFQWIWKKEKAKWNLAAPITILFVSEKMGKGSWRLFTDG